jgi:hypothetical protein
MKNILFCVVLLVIIVLPFQVFAQLAPEGACCYDNNTKCENVPNEPSCGDAPTGDGIFHANVTCADNPCRTTVPTMNEWGIIIFIVLAGLGAAFYLRKSKRAEN